MCFYIIYVDNFPRLLLLEQLASLFLMCLIMGSQRQDKESSDWLLGLLETKLVQLWLFFCPLFPPHILV